MVSIGLCLTLFLTSGAGVAQQYLISTVAGGAPPLTPVLASNAAIGYPRSIVSARDGSLYFVALNCVFKIDRNGVLTRVAGNSRLGYSGDGGPAIDARLGDPFGVAVDDSGNIFIADTQNNRVRKVTANGVITTIAGNGSSGYSGDGGPATAAALVASNVAADKAGNVYIVDGPHYRVRRVNAAGVISTFAGNGIAGHIGDGGPAVNAQLGESGNIPTAVAVDNSGTVYIADVRYVRRVSPSGIIDTVAGGGMAEPSDGGSPLEAQIGPVGIAVDDGSTIYIAGYSRVYKFTAGGVITTIAGNGSPGYSGDGGLAKAAQLYAATSVAVDGSGSVYICDFVNNRVRLVSTTGIITTLAGNGLYSYSGDGGKAVRAQLRFPTGVAVDLNGNLYIADNNNQSSDGDEGWDNGYLCGRRCSRY